MRSLDTLLKPFLQVLRNTGEGDFPDLDPTPGETVVCIDRPGGGETLYLDQNELVEFDRDPEAFAARYYGFADVDPYREWVTLDGTALCGEQTKSGKLCRNSISHIQLRAADWKALHRTRPCTVHTKKTGVRS